MGKNLHNRFVLSGAGVVPPPATHTWSLTGDCGLRNGLRCRGSVGDCSQIAGIPVCRCPPNAQWQCRFASQLVGSLDPSLSNMVAPELT